MQKGQSAIEFLAVYTWTFVIITIMLAVVASFLIAKGPVTYVPPTCYISIDISCQNLVVMQNSSGSTAIVVYYFNAPPTGAKIPAVNSFSIESAFAQNAFFGQCSPTVVSAHTYVTCNASMKGYKPGLGAQLDLSFIVSWNYCNAKGVCQLYNTSGTGTAFETSSSGNFINRVIVTPFCVTCTPTSNGLVFVDGGLFSGTAASSPSFIGTVSYIIYAQPPSGHTFNSWIPSSNVVVTNTLSQSTTAFARGSGTLEAKFN